METPASSNPTTEVITESNPARAAFRQARKDPAMCKSFTTLARYVTPLLNHPSEKTLLHLYAGMADKDTGQFQASSDYAEIQTGNVRSTVTKANNALKTLGILSWVSGSGNQYYEKSNDYTLHRLPLQALAVTGVAAGDKMMDARFAARTVKRSKDAGKRMRRSSAVPAEDTQQKSAVPAEDTQQKSAETDEASCCDRLDELLRPMRRVAETDENSAETAGSTSNNSLLNAFGEPLKENHWEEPADVVIAPLDVTDGCFGGMDGGDASPLPLMPESSDKRSPTALAAASATGGATEGRVVTTAYSATDQKTNPFYAPAPTNGRKNPLFDTVMNVERIKQMSQRPIRTPEQLRIAEAERVEDDRHQAVFEEFNASRVDLDDPRRMLAIREHEYIVKRIRLGSLVEMTVSSRA